MYALIYGNLDRQVRALDLLSALQEEEFSLLVARNTEAIMSLEFSIHELLRQIAVEKEQAIRRLDGCRVLDYADMLADGDQAEEVRALWNRIDNMEQTCARQATRNTKLSLALMDQSKQMLDYLHSRILPPQQDTYGRKGRYAQHHPEAALISGRL